MVNCKKYYITSQCIDPAEPSCLTLSQLADNTSHYLHFNANFILQQGSHILTSELSFANATYVFIHGPSLHPSVLKCEDNGQLSFDYIGNVSISNVNFHQCRGNQVRLVNQFILKHCLFLGHNSTAISFINSTVIIVNCSFNSNTVGSFYSIEHKHIDAVIIITASNVTIEECYFEENHANTGGIVFAEQHSIITVTRSHFAHNEVTQGGVIFLKSSHIIISVSTFSNNTATEDGTVLLLHTRSVINATSIILDCNKADQGIMYLVESTGVFKGNTEVSNNIGSLLIYYSNATFSGKPTFTMNTVNLPTHFHRGGAITAIRSHVYFEGQSSLSYNSGENGGAIHVVATKFYVYGFILLLNNSATDSGGGIYLFLSDLNCEKNCIFNIVGNSAGKGGGIHAVTSLVTAVDGSAVNFRDNLADENGGGIYLEVSAKINILIIGEHSTSKSDHQNRSSTFLFSGNSAGHKGGAIYVEDGTYFGTCNATRMPSTASECFLQAIIVDYEVDSYMSGDQGFSTVKFMNNHALRLQGPNLYGGLLDRCTLSPFSYRYRKISRQLQAIQYFKKLSGITNLDTIHSDPVRLCFCNRGKVDCSYQPPSLSVMKGQKFSVSLATVDQAGHTISAVVATLLSPNNGKVVSENNKTDTDDICTDLSFSVVSSYNKIELVFYAYGPCKDANLSRCKVLIEFSNCSCPIGFQMEVTNDKCACKCDERLTKFVEIAKCIHQDKTVVRRTNSWIAFTNNKGFSGYLVHRHCPLNYCTTTVSVPINLTSLNGPDIQCTLNRIGVLCGSCKSNFSISLGSSNCVACHSYWPAVFTGVVLLFILAGLSLVALLLVLNMTVAVGTINGIVFYANIVDANTGTFFPTSKPTYISVFISWLNLDFGFDICFIKNLDAYWKTWLQLAFPVYVIFLVVIVIIISQRSNKFTQLIGRKDPVATLATLIFLSYTKFLKVVITGLSCTTLTYSGLNGEHYDMPHVWLADATLQCYGRKHIILLIVTVFIFLAGVTYTILLFSWQWLLYLHNKFLGSQMRVWSLKLSLFIETYHSPYAPQHRYWTGLLLLVRVILYITSTANVSRDPSIDLLTVGIIMLCLLLFKEIIVVRSHVYKKWPLEILEVTCYVNLTLFSFATLFALKSEEIRLYVSYTSVSITFVLFLGVLLYHVSEVALKTKTCMTIKKHSIAVLRRDSKSFEEDIELTEAHCHTSSMFEKPKKNSVKVTRRETSDGLSYYDWESHLTTY